MHKSADIVECPLISAAFTSVSPSLCKNNLSLHFLKMKIVESAFVEALNLARIGAVPKI